MNPFSLTIWNDECERCTFYTVQFLDDDNNETDKFFDKFFSNEKYLDEIRILLNFVLQDIGMNNGAIDDLVNRHEDSVKGLPNKWKKVINSVTHDYPNFPLRLYVLKITDNILILFSGGLKDGETNQTSTLLPNWRMSCEMAERILEEIKSGMVIVDGKQKKLFSYNDTDEIIIY